MWRIDYTQELLEMEKMKQPFDRFKLQGDFI